MLRLWLPSWTGGEEPMRVRSSSTRRHDAGFLLLLKSREPLPKPSRISLWQVWALPPDYKTGRKKRAWGFNPLAARRCGRLLVK